VRIEPLDPDGAPGGQRSNILLHREAFSVRRNQLRLLEFVALPQELLSPGLKRPLFVTDTKSLANALQLLLGVLVLVRPLPVSALLLGFIARSNRIGFLEPLHECLNVGGHVLHLCSIWDVATGQHQLVEGAAV